jgi:hypothetical protein
MYEEYFLELKEFLASYAQIWQKEVLEQFPVAPNRQLFQWSQQLSFYTNSQLIDLENSHELDHSHSKDFKEVVDKILLLENKLKNIGYKAVPPTGVQRENFRKMNPKKIHELQHISNLVNEKKLQGEHIIDFGGGVGHLCQQLSRELNINSTCFDLDLKLLSAGELRLERHYPGLKKRINFHHAKISQDMKLDAPDNSLFIGLHACGSLSNYLIDFYARSNAKSFISFGCCYHKHDNENLFNLSKMAKNNPLDLSKHAQTLAAKSNSYITHQLFDERVIVKKYRYAFHLLLNKFFDVHEFQGLGNYSKQLYMGSFEQYAQHFLNKLSLNLEHSQITEFYQDRTLHKNIEFLIKAGVIRGLFGRLIEIYILLDRTLYLKDLGHEVSMLEVFEKRISPRNIAIVSSS